MEIGRIVRPHGLGGEVIVNLTSNRSERLAPGNTFLISGVAESRELTLISARPHQHRYIVTFEGVVDRAGADDLREALLLAPRIVDPEAMFVHDLIGSELVELSGESHGRVVSVQANPASDLLVGEKGWLVPLRFVVSRQPGKLVVEVPEGLFE